MKETSTEPKQPILWTNMITLIGLLLVATGLLLLCTFWIFHMLQPSDSENQYVNIIGFMILPGILVTGLILCPLGMFIRRWRFKHFKSTRHISARVAVIFLTATFFLILPVLGISGYEGYHYTETTEFCGSCHQVMEPQYNRHAQSPHSRVTCARCHVGPGAGPFLQSKLSGIRQLVKTTMGTYPRPVPAAISELRPARDTCEQCHWPEQFFGSQLRSIVRYSHDEQNSRHEYEMLLKVGGQNAHLGRSEGIHMHMVDHVEYVATDHELQEIPWVRFTDDKGQVTVYRSDDELTSAPAPAGRVRTLDCIDCHNLIGHDIPSPQKAVDAAMNVQKIDNTLPYIKHQAVSVLATPYGSEEEAFQKIKGSIESFYQTSYPEVWKQQREAIDRAVATLQDLYTRCFYPHMKTDWRTYPNNIGHTEFAGCFRCHDGRHKASDGRTISTNCISCHTFYTRDREENVITEGPFDHPMKIHNLWEEMGVHHRMLCTDCHDGGTKAMGETNVTSECGDCHSSGRWLEMKKELDVRLKVKTPDLKAKLSSAH